MLPAPPPADARAVAAGLPVPLTRLIGRDEALAELSRLLAGSRLITLTGAGGSGKTRLALELARRVAAAGIAAAWVDLASVTDATALPRRVAAALGLREQPGRGAVEALVETLADAPHLLVLDNCEHLLEPCAELVEHLLAGCPRLAVLTTSREALRLPGERAWLVPELSLPPAGATGEQPAGAPDLVALAGSGAVQLFVERAGEASRSFALTAENAAAVARICRRLDGLPLALELAAARVGVLGVEAVAERLDDAFRLLSSGARRAVPRHRTLHAAIDWSFSLLAEPERRVLARLAVFAGGFTLDAAEQVAACDATAAPEVFELLAGLAAKSLVALHEGPAGPRYKLLETVRQYALDRLREAGPDAEHAVRARHAAVYLALARAAEPRLLAADLAALDGLDAELDNVRAALAWSRAAGADDAVGLPLAAAFHGYWYYRVLWSEGRGWLEALLAATDPAARTPARAGALRGAGVFAWYCGEAELARQRLAEAATLWREIGDRRQLLFTLSPLAQALADAGELDAALACASEAGGLARESPWSWDLPYVLVNSLAFVQQRRGDLAAADASYAEAEAVWRGDGHRLGLPFVRNARARLALLAGDRASAARYARQALAGEAGPSGDPWFGSRALRTLAYCALDDGQPARAARLLAGAGMLLRSIGATVMPFEKGEHQRARARLQEALPPEELAAAEAAGRAASIRQLLAELADDDAGAAAGDGGVHGVAIATPVGAPGPGSGGDATGSAAALRVRALGPLEIVLGERALGGAGWGATRAKELLLLLLCHPAGRTKDQVGAALWPDASPTQVHNVFHVTVHRLRKALGDPGWIVLDGDRYRLAPDRCWELDAALFGERLAAAREALSRDGGPAAVAALEAALALYRGPLLDGEEVGDWHLELRDRLHGEYCAALAALGAAHAAAGQPREAAEAYRRLLAADALHEEACRGLMASLARSGERAQALRVYRDVASRLWDELGTDPDPETTELFEQLQNGIRV